MLEIVLLCLAAGLAYLVASTWHQASALRQFKGPWSAQFSRLWIYRATTSGRQHEIFTNVNTEYGDLARIGPKILLTTNPELVKLMSAMRSPFTRSEFYKGLRLHPTRDHVLSLQDEAAHNAMRNRLAPGYSGKENFRMEDDIDHQLLKFFGLVQTSYISTEDYYRPADLSRVVAYLMLDIISTIAFGQAFGFMDANNDVFGYFENMTKMMPAIMVFSCYPELQALTRSRLLKPLLPKSTDKRGIGRAMGFAHERIAERFREEDRVVRKDMLQSFINRGLTQEELESETLIQVVAGSDTSATVFRMVLAHASTTPHIVTKLLAEFKQAIAEGKVSRPIIKDVEARQLPYLQACIKEGLRIRPPATGTIAKEVPKEGAILGGRSVPGGTWIGLNSFGMARITAIFGQDAEMFRPERWFEADEQRLQRMNETVHLVFGYGKYMCLGKGVAWMELNKAIVETLLRFELQLVNMAKPFTEFNVGLYLHDEMNFRITERVQ